MSRQGTGNDLETERLSPEYLLNRVDPVLLFRDAPSGVRRIDQKNVHDEITLEIRRIYVTETT
jgi:hypothetical protein